MAQAQSYQCVQVDQLAEQVMADFIQMRLRLDPGH